MSDVFLRAEWRKLILVNYRVDPKIIASLVPAGTETDYWNEHCYLSLVGFMFQHTRVKGIRIPWHMNFEEVNLRFYVKRYAGGELRRGVVFIKEIVPRKMIAWVARMRYNEPYASMPMQHCWKTTANTQLVKYAWQKDHWHSLEVHAGTQAMAIAPQSEEEFITEHYWGYNRQKNGDTAEYRVNHPAWQVYPVRGFEISVDFKKVYGASFSFLQSAKPASVFLAEGSEIEVYKGNIIRNM